MSSTLIRKLTFSLFGLLLVGAIGFMSAESAKAQVTADQYVDPDVTNGNTGAAGTATDPYGDIATAIGQGADNDTIAVELGSDDGSQVAIPSGEARTIVVVEDEDGGGHTTLEIVNGVLVQDGATADGVGTRLAIKGHDIANRTTVSSPIITTNISTDANTGDVAEVETTIGLTIDGNVTNGANGNAGTFIAGGDIEVTGTFDNANGATDGVLNLAGNTLTLSTPQDLAGVAAGD